MSTEDEQWSISVEVATKPPLPFHNLYTVNLPILGTPVRFLGQVKCLYIALFRVGFEIAWRKGPIVFHCHLGRPRRIGRWFDSIREFHSQHWNPTFMFFSSYSSCKGLETSILPIGGGSIKSPFGVINYMQREKLQLRSSLWFGTFSQIGIELINFFFCWITTYQREIYIGCLSVAAFSQFFWPIIHSTLVLKILYSSCYISRIFQANIF